VLRRISVVFVNFTLFWLTLTVVAFALGHWEAGVVCVVVTLGGGAGLAYRWRKPVDS
jgi:membrane protease YdiL (CAAX protease family)